MNIIEWLIVMPTVAAILYSAWLLWPMIQECHEMRRRWKQ